MVSADFGSTQYNERKTCRESSDEKAGVIRSCAASIGLKISIVTAARSPTAPFSVITEAIITTENNTMKAKITKTLDIGNALFQTSDFSPRTAHTPTNRYIALKTIIETPPRKREVIMRHRGIGRHRRRSILPF